MKNRPSIIRMALAALAAAAVCLAAPWSVARAQDTATYHATATLARAWPSGVSEVMKLFKGGISADIIVSYINNSTLSFYLSADNLIALQQEGVPQQVLTAMMQRYGQLQRKRERHPARPCRRAPRTWRRNMPVHPPKCRFRPRPRSIAPSRRHR